MLDLKQLEANLDALLETETTESLTKWLTEQRGGNIHKYKNNYLDYLNSALHIPTQKQVNAVIFSSENSNIEQNYSHYTFAA